MVRMAFNTGLLKGLLYVCRNRFRGIITLLRCLVKVEKSAATEARRRVQSLCLSLCGVRFVKELNHKVREDHAPIRAHGMMDDEVEYSSQTFRVQFVRKDSIENRLLV